MASKLNRKDAKNLQLLQTSRRIVHEMVIDRGYAAPVYIPESLQTLYELKVSGRLGYSFRNASGLPGYPIPQKELIVIFEINTKIGKDEIKKIITDYTNRDVIIILIYRLEPTPDAKKTTREQYTCRFQLFNILDIQANVSKHAFTPKIRILTTEERREFHTVNKITFQQLPKILISDPLAKYYDLSVGQIVEVENVNLTNETLADRGISYYAIDRN